MQKLAERNVTVMAMDSVPRISRAQSLDALSSMANIAGYRAIVEAAHELGASLPGKLLRPEKRPPAKVMVIVWVLQVWPPLAQQTVGAIVRAFDTRPEVKEQVQSMGADSSSWILKRKSWQRRWLCQSDVGRVHQSGNGTLCRPGKRGRYHCHHRAYSRQTSAEANYP
ncbi:hypothetical protein ACLK15_09365 [Escherichia coli]